MDYHLIKCLLGVICVSLVTCQDSDQRCDVGYVCISGNDCPAHIELRKKLSKLTRSSPAYKDLLVKIRKGVCNRTAQKVCCEVEVEDEAKVEVKECSDNQSSCYIPKLGECGVANSDLGFIVGTN